MKTGIGPYYYLKYEGKGGGERMRKHGYDYLDFDRYFDTESELYPDDPDEFVSFTKALSEKLKSCGYTVWQIHGPWRAPQDSTEEDRNERFEKMSKALLAASILGAKYMAIHPIMPFGVGKHTENEAAELYKINRDFFTRLACVGESLGVVVCLENMPFPDLPLSSAEQMLNFVREIDHPYLRMCLDTGHANVVPPSPAEAVRMIGKEYLAILHVHDNDGSDDTHLNPYDERGTVDWNDFSSALAEIGFEGVVNLETSVKTPCDSDAELEALEAELGYRARKIAGQIH